MGMPCGISRSSYDSPFQTIIETVKETIIKKVMPNPDPKNYDAHRWTVLNGMLIVEVVYPDCKNYEGKKILVFDDGVTLTELHAQGSIDPHFSESKKHHSPIARFEPTSRGWNMAISFVEHLWRSK